MTDHNGAQLDPLEPATPPDRGRSLPQNHEAEESVIGGALFGGAPAWRAARAVMELEDLFSAPLVAIGQAMDELDRDGGAIEPLTVAAELRRTGKISKLLHHHGECYLEELANNISPRQLESIAAHAGLVRRAALQRAQLEKAAALQELLAQGKDGGALPQELATLRAQELAIGTARPSSAIPALFCGDIFGQVAPEVLPTSIEAINQLLDGGWQTYSYIVLSGPTKHGKSTAGLQEARHQAEQGRPVLYVTAEMRRREILSRLVSQRVSASHQQVNRSYWTKEHEPDIWVGLQGLDRLRILEFRPGMTLTSIFEEIKRYAHEVGVAPFVVLDYAQRLLSRTIDPRSDPRMAAGQFSDALAEATRDTGACILCLSAIPRSMYGERAMEKLSDDELNAAPKEGGGWEYDAGALLMLRRRGKPMPDGRCRATLKITGQRFAAPSTMPIRLILDGAHNLLVPDLTEQEEDPLHKEILAELDKPVHRLGLSLTAVQKVVQRRREHVLEALDELVDQGLAWRDRPKDKRGGLYRADQYKPSAVQIPFAEEK